jgi:hypothetical protein
VTIACDILGFPACAQATVREKDSPYVVDKRFNIR